MTKLRNFNWKPDDINVLEHCIYGCYPCLHTVLLLPHML